MWAVFIGGFTPLPYKLFTITAGLFYVDMKKFVLASIASRGLRFFAVAGLIMLYGDIIVLFIGKYFNIITIAIVVLALIGYFIYKKYTK